jgi:hypothetical protein
MRFISMHMADVNSEAGIPPSAALIVSMGKLMGQMTAAGVLVAGEGLQPSSRSVRLTFSGGTRTVMRGPLTGSNELIAGFAIVRAASMEEAIEWASRYAKSVGDIEIDIGVLKEPWDLGLCPKPEGQARRFMIMHKADEGTEAGVFCTPELPQAERAFAEDGMNSGVCLSTERLKPSSKGVRLTYSGGKRAMIDGPFTESKELVGGYCILQVKSTVEAIEWVSRFANVLGDVEIDLRPLYETPDVGEET